jgi:hypothetical protein
LLQRLLYVSPQIEAALGFSQKEWLEDPVPGIGRFIPTNASPIPFLGGPAS